MKTFASSVSSVVDLVGFYAIGSLATRDYQPGISDLDLVAVVRAEPTGEQRERMRQFHEHTQRNEPTAAKLHCAYVALPTTNAVALPTTDAVALPTTDAVALPTTDAVALPTIGDVAASHLVWAHGKLYRRPLTGIARAELLRAGITVLGPPPTELFPPVSSEALRLAVRKELTGFWRSAVRKPWLWLDDLYVDLGLTTIARAEAVLVEDRLITKREALTRLARFDVPDSLVRDIDCRRYGEPIILTRRQQISRAHLARRLCAAGIRSLTDLTDG